MTARLLTLVLAASATSVFADTLTLTDSTKLTGRVISQDDSSVVFEPDSGGPGFRQTFPRSKITSLEVAPAISGPAYLQVPLIGKLGREITADSVAQSIVLARSLKATHIVFLFDSPGGRLDEVDRILDVLDKNNDLTTIAFIKEAGSFTAVVAGACREIIMHREGKVGSERPYLTNLDDLASDQREKLRGVVERSIRKASSIGNHSPNMLLAMLEPSVDLWVTREGDRALLTLGQPSTPAANVKPKGRSMLLNADQAVQFGFARGTATTMKDVAALLKIPSWSTCGEDGWTLMRHYWSTLDAQPFPLTSSDPPPTSTPDAPASNSPVAALQARITESQTNIATLKKASTDLEANYARELKKLEDARDDATAKARATANAAAFELQARLTYESAKAQLDADVQGKRVNIQQLLSDNTKQLESARRKLRDLQ